MKILITLLAVTLSGALMATAAFAFDRFGGGENGSVGNPDAPEDVIDNDDVTPGDFPAGDLPDGDRPVSSDDPVVIDLPEPADAGDRVVVEAPIDAIDIRVMESFPVQYGVHIVSGLPSGCAQFDDLRVDRDGNTIRITVTNTMPAGDVICTAIYGMKEHNVNLGSDFVSGETYTVVVNGESVEFVAQ